MCPFPFRPFRGVVFLCNRAKHPLPSPLPSLPVFSVPRTGENFIVSTVQGDISCFRANFRPLLPPMVKRKTKKEGGRRGATKLRYLHSPSVFFALLYYPCFSSSLDSSVNFSSLFFFFFDFSKRIKEQRILLSRIQKNIRTWRLDYYWSSNCENEKLFKLESYYIVNQEVRIRFYICVCFEGLIFYKAKTYVHSSELSNQSVGPFLRFKIVTMVKIAGSRMNERTVSAFLD